MRERVEEECRETDHQEITPLALEYEVGCFNPCRWCNICIFSTTFFLSPFDGKCRNTTEKLGNGSCTMEPIGPNLNRSKNSFDPLLPWNNRCPNNSNTLTSLLPILPTHQGEDATRGISVDSITVIHMHHGYGRKRISSSAGTRFVFGPSFADAPGVIRNCTNH